MIKKTLDRWYRILGGWYLIPTLKSEWRRSAFKKINERAIEFGFALKWLSKICPGDVLDVGSGKSAWPCTMVDCGFHVTAIDKIQGYWAKEFVNRHYYVINDDITKPKIMKQFDLITCISVLEHIPNHKAAIKGMFKLLKPGGYLILTIPYNEKQYIDNVYKLPGAGYGQDASWICQVFSRSQLDAWLNENPGKIIEQKYYQIFNGDFWTFGERIYPPLEVKKQEKCHLTCVVIQKT